MLMGFVSLIGVVKNNTTYKELKIYWIKYSYEKICF